MEYACAEINAVRKMYPKFFRAKASRTIAEKTGSTAFHRAFSSLFSINTLVPLALNKK